jgi:hypothetical protein
MADQDESPPRRRAADFDTDVNLAGWDPYIVELTGTPCPNMAGESAGRAASDHVEGRKIQLMAWLREHDG